MREKVQFKQYRRWERGTIHKVSKRKDGKYFYVIKYNDVEIDLDNNEVPYVRYTNPLTKKNICKI